MTPSETTAMIDKHLESWLGSDASHEPGKTLRDRIAAMIAEAEKKRDELWQAGNATLRHERDALAQSRDDAVQAAHLIAEELAECKRRAGA